MNSIKGLNRSTVLQYAVLIFLALIALGPIIVMFITSFKTQVDIMSSESMWVFQPTFDNYTHVFENKFDLFLRNSIIVSLASTVLSLLVAGMAAYALSRLEFPGRSPIAYFTLIIRMVPPAVLAIPIFILWLNWELFLFDLIDATPFLYEMDNPDPYLFAEGLVDGRIGLTLFYTALNLPFAIWLLIGFLRQIPTEIEEAAIVDGCSQWQVFTRIIFPLMRPGLAVAAIFTFRISWNEFLLALVLTDRNTRTLPVGITLFLTEQGVQWGRIMAMGTLIVIPPLVLTFVAARQIIAGMTAGAVKG
ncbi:MAG: carbohydrate ABC transporter permease [Chloroflexi bacterium]|nr:carbohydrate ABC transporter permease [Chloroflexota bacterium]MCY3916833.1 carbohydrate ABC transporter permease [Chloroflexota bacterium]